ncbi:MULTISPECIES: DUF6379 domain-containing protein [unclassified Actinomyces]|uniref:C-glycoside deglycosidase beta subunit domain-containing protein n=1 Tax=unclassified Actinomyces TaxID=2609248 RepID=UPI00201812E0|nr:MULTISPECIES: DUF6379 domain-containing protein [unclassified Actinomyces]MCL3777457.1 hypothetical protein [Actinomyces sp. AC-20-1]MCL3790173.1 hypothetical protein [Actinomyces sp. 187325]MCL3792298.1 hypothetical protein [Actinomyces sp. 186855]MCL3794873.1 hypothetical protein [Actinomyces sp. 217892]
MTSFTDMVMDGSPVLRDGDDLLVPLRLPWYRSLALSTFEGLDLSLNGTAIDPATVRLEVNGHSYALAELADLTEKFWFMQDTGYVRLPAPEGVGGCVEVAASTRQRIPYILVGPDQCMVKHTHQTLALEVQDA